MSDAEKKMESVLVKMVPAYPVEGGFILHDSKGGRILLSDKDPNVSFTAAVMVLPSHPKYKELTVDESSLYKSKDDVFAIKAFEPTREPRTSTPDISKIECPGQNATRLGGVYVRTYFQDNPLGYDFQLKIVSLAAKGDDILERLDYLIRNEKKAVAEAQKRSKRFDPFLEGNMELQWQPADDEPAIVLAMTFGSLPQFKRHNPNGGRTLQEMGVKPAGHWRLDINYRLCHDGQPQK